ncbi:TyeA family type III secretion system gatekeeper subunit [Caenimonas sp. SL110]|uniref:TyeA family type III secretion system gatekeeper subunit n=1 Tax=Caenimonas sp. SL110 TaxID=1450524 RepID=UPI0006529469|nr:TyeA family type III secretion system gatekeeper subunit [Caenimonas sp. SL110]
MNAEVKAIDANLLLGRLVEMIDGSSALAMQFDRLARDLQIEEGEPKIIFLSGVKKIFRELPEKAFNDKNARLAMVDAVQDALDAAIDAEEEMLDNKDDEGGR